MTAYYFWCDGDCLDAPISFAEGKRWVDEALSKGNDAYLTSSAREGVEIYPNGDGYFKEQGAMMTIRIKDPQPLGSAYEVGCYGFINRKDGTGTQPADSGDPENDGPPEGWRVYVTCQVDEHNVEEILEEDFTSAEAASIRAEELAVKYKCGVDYYSMGE